MIVASREMDGPFEEKELFIVQTGSNEDEKKNTE